MYKEKNMEYIAGLAVLAAAWFVFFRKKDFEPEVKQSEAPYKVETPEAKVEVVNAQPVVEEKPAEKPAKAKKAPAKKAAKPKAEKAPAKKAAPKAKKPKA